MSGEPVTGTTATKKPGYGIADGGSKRGDWRRRGGAQGSGRAAKSHAIIACTERPGWAELLLASICACKRATTIGDEVGRGFAQELSRRNRYTFYGNGKNNMKKQVRQVEQFFS